MSGEKCPKCNSMIGHGPFHCDETNGRWCRALQLAQAQGKIADLADENKRLRNSMDGLLAEHRRLKAIVDKLPKTADGVPYISHDGSMFWCWWRYDDQDEWKLAQCRQCCDSDEAACMDDEDGWLIESAKDDCELLGGNVYSTEAAALAAKEQP